MGDIDGETLDWLGGLKLGEKLQYVSDFDNGYYMGVIFERHNLAKGRKFKNTKDTACKFQNFKNVRDLLIQNFSVDFPIQNILFNTEPLLRTIKECMLKYNRDKKQAALKKIESFSTSKIQPHEQKLFANRHRDILSTSKMNQSKFPKKIQEIQQKLQKYKSIKTQHELMALEDRKRELEDNRRLIDEHRIYEINKVRTNHEFIKEHERKVYDVWMKTEQIKQTRVEKDNNLKSFLDEKKNKFYQSLRDQQVKGFKEGLQAFNLNCMRQGIELEHDPDKPLRKTEQGFNKQVVMERIKDNIKIHQRQRKQRIKRENKKTVDAKEANIKSETIWNENNLVEKYAKRIKTQINKCQKIKKTINREEAERIGAAHRNSIRTFSELPESKIDNAKRQDEYRRRKIQYLDEQVERLERRQRKHKAIAENVLQALIHVVVQSEQQYKSSNGFNFQEWKALERQFLSFERKDKRSKDLSKFVDSSYENKAKEYINSRESWQEEHGEKQVKLELSNAISQVISIGFPEKVAPEVKSIPLYMPLKIGLVGDPLSGKTTLSQKIAQKYGIIFINPVAIITQAFELNKQPVFQDPKKKKDSKKPEQQNPEKLALKEWGERLMKRLSSPASATLEHYIEAIQFKVNYSFTNKAGQQILKEFQQSKIQEAQRYAKAVKDFEETQKKGKKDSKKGAQQSQEPPTQKKYFYSKGFVIDGVDLSAETVREIECKLNGYMSFEQKINQKGEEIKQTISNIIKVPLAQKDPRLVRGTFDLMIELSASDETLESRQAGEKTKVSHKDLHSLEHYYSDFGNQATKVKAYKKISNNATIDECFAEVSRIIEEHLDSKYQEILSSRPTSNEEETVQQQPVAASPYSQITKPYSQKLLKKLMQIYNKYSKKVSQSFSDFDNLRDDFSKLFLSTQQAFINIINRPDDKAGKILNFQQNYNKLQSQKVNIVKDVEASKHLISKLDELYDGLWVSLEGKKNQAVQERQKLLNSSMLNSQIEKVVEVSRNLMQNELTLLIQLIFFIYDLNNALQGSQEELSPEYLVLGIPAHLEPIYSFEKQEHISDRLDYYTKQVRQCLSDLPQWLAKREKKFKITKSEQITRILQEFIEDRRGKIESKLQRIRGRVKEYYLEYYCYFKVLVNKMDDWIIQGIKYENEFVYDIYKAIKKSIQEARKSAIKDLFVRDITDLLHPLTCLPANRLPVLPSSPSHFKLLSYAVFMQELKCLSSNGRIPFKIFQAYIEKRRKSQLLEKEFLAMELDIMQQYLVTDDYCNYREVALALLLWRVKILEEDEIAEYEQRLTGRRTPSQEDYPIKEEYPSIKEDLTLDQFAIIPLISQDREEQRMLKVFIFEVFRQDFRDSISVKELIDTLRLFSQLQVYRYGDTLMTLREATLKQVEGSP